MKIMEWIILLIVIGFISHIYEKVRPSSNDNNSKYKQRNLNSLNESKQQHYRKLLQLREDLAKERKELCETKILKGLELSADSENNEKSDVSSINHKSDDIIELNIVEKHNVQVPPPWERGDEPPLIDSESGWLAHSAKINQSSFAIGNVLSAYGQTSIWHMTHIDNLQSIFRAGLLSHTRARLHMNPVDISNADVQTRRNKREPIYQRQLHDYVPTYLNPRNPMLYVRREQQADICIIEIALNVLNRNQYIFSDGNAASQDTRFYSNPDCLEYLPWDALRDTYWNDFIDGKRKRCAEFLIHSEIESKYILAVHCYNNLTKHRLNSMGISAKVSPERYF